MDSDKNLEMKIVEQLSSFSNRIVLDNRIIPSHISIYMALLQCWNKNHFKNPISITRRKIMEAAKINSIATYHKCIKNLHDWHYIQYMPTYDPILGSTVFLELSAL